MMPGRLNNSFRLERRENDLVSFDIVFVTFNSEKWIHGLFSSLMQSKYDLQKIHLFFVDNHSSDHTVSVLEEQKQLNQNQFGSFVIHKSDCNMGFGAGNNVGASFGNSPFVFCLNIDTELFDDTLQKLSEAIEQEENERIALWELRQFPYEHPNFYDPLTGETSWASGAAFVIRREVFESIGGFDESFFMYAEDVDLSWRVRTAGYQLRYVPKAVIRHFCYTSAGEVKPTQYIYSAVGNLHLRYKFGSITDKLWGWSYITGKLLMKRAPFPQGRRRLLSALIHGRADRRNATRWRKAHQKELQKEEFTFYGMGYAQKRKGDFWTNERPDSNVKVSVIVRTCDRPEVLRETLISLRAQTYPNLEIVVVEDGKDCARQMIKEEFSDLNIIYQATGEKVGRCKTGNLGLSLASGEYMNFLDDDDVFYADHIETLVMALQNHPDHAAAYALGFETPIQVLSKEPYRYRLFSYLSTIDIPFSKVELIHHNCFPIQAVLFRRKLYEKYGGFDEQLDVLEDWDLWLRYASEEQFVYVPKTTSQYRVHASATMNAERQKELDAAYTTVQSKHRNTKFILSGEELIKENELTLKKIVLSARSSKGKKTIADGLFRGMRSVYHGLSRLKNRVKAALFQN